ncbi:uncharacterized protein METZ01_LOCUS277236 [marine metagenome]|uniref:Uncharacterized protein n=1 Tax=marine metagenome TaxID=408172 RepID=A0A382KM32_9ZZZZ
MRCKDYNFCQKHTRTVGGVYDTSYAELHVGEAVVEGFLAE